jgi:hypothetical protein
MLQHTFKADSALCHRYAIQCFKGGKRKESERKKEKKERMKKNRKKTKE